MVNRCYHHLLQCVFHYMRHRVLISSQVENGMDRRSNSKQLNEASSRQQSCPAAAMLVIICEFWHRRFQI